MKKQIFAILSAVVLSAGAYQASASVVVSNLDPANPAFGENAPTIGEAMLTSNRPISLTSVMFLQTAATNDKSFTVYSRNADGTLGSALFADFTVGFDSTSSVTTATVNGSFTLQANTGYFFVLSSGTTTNIEWTYTSSTDYASAFGATLPATNTSFFTTGGTTVYRTLAQGPQEIQVNGNALPAVPEPSAGMFMGLVFTVGAGAILRRRLVIA